MRASFSASNDQMIVETTQFIQIVICFFQNITLPKFCLVEAGTISTCSGPANLAKLGINLLQ